MSELALLLAAAANPCLSLSLPGKLKPLTGRSAPRLHPEILQSFGISVKLLQFI